MKRIEKRRQTLEDIRKTWLFEPLTKENLAYILAYVFHDMSVASTKELFKKLAIVERYRLILEENEEVMYE